MPPCQSRLELGYKWCRRQRKRASNELCPLPSMLAMCQPESTTLGTGLHAGGVHHRGQNALFSNFFPGLLYAVEAESRIRGVRTVPCSVA
ncbi:uncharacterized protein G2W53_022074 [Senna tora]|uniref:Uncharacterized protein n=1 Tax=Senna tora TaxID=362788 RepID=A0A834TNT6_9FABA|nr:uncharacterized protein G2W53_022074 [Senna tora]